MLTQFGSFALVGALGTAVHYGVMFAMLTAAGWAPEAATTLGALCGAAINYLLNYRFTFRSQAPHRVALAKFLAVAAAGVAINAAAVAVLTRALPVAVAPAQLAATALVLIWGFLANRVWTFGGGQ